jgi:hypothetical protein
MNPDDLRMWRMFAWVGIIGLATWAVMIAVGLAVFT